ncbi:MAG: uroporphyrinogen decarboxylase [Solirubrobacteraceae bacterium]
MHARANPGATSDAVNDLHPDRSAPLLAAYRGEGTERVPVWFMRQAGRALPEYRAVRARAGLLEITHTPELAAEVTLQPVRRYGVDAAILFSDIVSPLAAIGVKLEIRPGVGPVIASPVRGARDLQMLREFEPSADAPWLAAACRLVVAESQVPLIGFVGGPFTLASYLVEGGPSKAQARTKALMLSDASTWTLLLERLCAIALASARAQVEAGAAAIQVFDSWIGSLSADQYERHVLGVVRNLFEGLADLGVPRVYFGVGTGHLLELLAQAGPDVIGVDWRVPLDLARARIPEGVGLQGNLDPVACLAPAAALEAEVRTVLARAPQRGYVFNLGHGVLPETAPEAISRVVDLVHSWRPVSSEGEVG